MSRTYNNAAAIEGYRKSIGIKDRRRGGETFVGCVAARRGMNRTTLLFCVLLLTASMTTEVTAVTPSPTASPSTFAKREARVGSSGIDVREVNNTKIGVFDGAQVRTAASKILSLFSEGHIEEAFAAADEDVLSRLSVLPNVKNPLYRDFFARPANLKHFQRMLKFLESMRHKPDPTQLSALIKYYAECNSEAANMLINAFGIGTTRVRVTQDGRTIQEGYSRAAVTREDDAEGENRDFRSGGRVVG